MSKAYSISTSIWIPCNHKMMMMKMKKQTFYEKKKINKNLQKGK